MDLKSSTIRFGEQQKRNAEGKMGKLVCLFAVVLVAGCATAHKINAVSLGMSKDEVIRVMGKPASISAIEGTEYLNYKLAETSNDDWYGISTPYYVCIRGGKVISYGRTGDFDSTKDPTQVIKIVGDIKSDEKIKVEAGNDEELATKLKTLNKLLADGLITKTEFDEQKKKLLNDFTSK